MAMHILGNVLSRGKINLDFPTTAAGWTNMKESHDQLRNQKLPRECFRQDLVVVTRSKQLQSAPRMMSRPDPAITIGSLGSQTFSRTLGSALMTDDRKTRAEGLTGKRDYLD